MAAGLFRLEVDAALSGGQRVRGVLDEIQEDSRKLRRVCENRGVRSDGGAHQRYGRAEADAAILRASADESMQVDPRLLYGVLTDQPLPGVEQVDAALRGVFEHLQVLVRI